MYQDIRDYLYLLKIEGMNSKLLVIRLTITSKFHPRSKIQGDGEMRKH